MALVNPKSGEHNVRLGFLRAKQNRTEQNVINISRYCIRKALSVKLSVAHNINIKNVNRKMSNIIKCKLGTWNLELGADI